MPAAGTATSKRFDGWCLACATSRPISTPPTVGRRSTACSRTWIVPTTSMETTSITWATAPEFFLRLVKRLAAEGLLDDSAGGWRRVIIEKPFGHDLDSARALNRE